MDSCSSSSSSTPSRDELASGSRFSSFTLQDGKVDVVTSSDTCLFDTLPNEIEHKIHEYLRVSDVCCLREVSAEWASRITAALQRDYLWDVVVGDATEDDDGIDSYLRLALVAKSRVKTRSIRVSDVTSNTSVFYLHRACANGHTDVVRLLLAASDVDVNALHQLGYTPYTPLCYAATSGHAGIVKMMLAHPNVKANCPHGYRLPLHLAASKGHADIVNMLLAMPDVDVNALDQYNRTALYDATRSSHADVVKILLAVPNVDVNLTRGDAVPLVIAADRGNMEIVDMLLAMPDIDVQAVNSFEYSPLFCAMSARHADVVKRLRAAIDIRCGEQHVDNYQVLRCSCSQFPAR